MERRSFVAGAVYSTAATALPLGLLAESSGRAHAASAGRIAGTADIEAVYEMTALFSDVEHRRGAQYGQSTAVGYFVNEVLPLCRARFRTVAQRSEMLLAAASLTRLLGWRAFDFGEQGLAQRYFLQGLRLTREAGSDVHTAFLLRAMAQHAYLLKRPENVVAMADRALSLASGKVDAATEAMFTVTRARALACDGQDKRAVHEATRAGRLAAGADDADRVPNWSALEAPAAACVAHTSAEVLTDVGDYGSAETMYAQAARGLGGLTRYRGAQLLSQADLQCRQGRVEEACHTLDAALDGLTGVRSVRVTDAVRRMRASLAQYRRRGIAAVSHTDERARVWLAAAV